MKAIQVKELEARLKFALPEDYRCFLNSHCDSFLPNSRIFKKPRSGLIDILFTADEILENEENNKIGLPEQSLMHIGGNLSGGYLYLDVSRDRFGEIRYSENYVFKERFKTFTQFIQESEINEA